MNIRCFCCMGDSITSDQVSGIGTGTCTSPISSV